MRQGFDNCINMDLELKRPFKKLSQVHQCGRVKGFSTVCPCAPDADPCRERETQTHTGEGMTVLNRTING